MAGNDITDLQERWHLEEQADGTWTGALQNNWTGLAEYQVRSEVRGLSPQQRDYVLQTELAKQLDNADFTGLSLTPADDLSIPLQMSAQVSVPFVPSPRSGFDIATDFAPPQRNQPLLINNGQKLHLKQTLELTYKASDPGYAPAPFHAEAGGIRTSATWERTGDHSWRRTAELSVDNPLVSQADYPSVRRMLRNWTDNLTRQQVTSSPTQSAN
jgi:hypothetical protein